MEHEVLIQSVTPKPNDVLIVEGFVDGAKVVAEAWQSALTNHFDADQYSAEGQLEAEYDVRGKDDAAVVIGIKRQPKPRVMAAGEQKEYFQRLLLDAAGVAKPAFEIDAGVIDEIPAAYLAPVATDEPTAEEATAPAPSE